MSDELSCYHKHLKAYYKHASKDKLENKFSVTRCSEFINLALIEKPKDSEEKKVGVKSCNVDEIMASSKTPLNFDALVTPDSPFILVEGRPGIGKSTLCWELCRKWDTLESLKHFKIVLLLSLREKRVQNATELKDIFVYEDDKVRESVAREVCRSQGEGVLLIFDGFDEMPTSIVDQENSFIMKLISGTSLPSATHLVTSRPSAPDRKNIFSSDQYKNVEVLGFTDESKKKFAEIVFKEKPKELELFNSLIMSNPIINSLMYIPINCAIIAQIYKDEIDVSEKLSFKTMTELYTVLVLVLIRKHMIDTGKWNKRLRFYSNLKKLPEKVSFNLKRVSKLAYRGLFEKEVQLEFSSSDVGEGFDHLGLLSVSKEMYVTKGAKTSYSFPHLSMQEFLAAWHVSGQPDLIKQNARLFEYLDFLPAHLNAFVRFLAGMVEHIELFLKPVKVVSKLLLHCLFETQNPSNFKLLLTKESDIAVDNSLDGYILGYALVHAPIQWRIMHFGIPAFEMFQSSIAHHSQSDSDIIQGSILWLSTTPYQIAKFLQPTPPYSFSKLKDLPKCLLQSIATFSFQITDSCKSIDGLIAGISEMHNLSAIHMTFDSCTCHNYCKLFESLQNLQILKEVYFILGEMADPGMQEMLNYLSSNPTLEHLTINDLAIGKQVAIRMNNNCHVIKHALSCSRISAFTTDIPFLISKFPNSLKSVTIGVPVSPLYTTTGIGNFICHVADLCKVSSVESLSFGFPFMSMPLQLYCNFLSILNNSLHFNQAMKSLDILLLFRNFKPFENYSLLSRALQRDSDVLRSNIWRSNSLCDLATPTHPFRFSKKKSKSLVVSKSCPDLLELQSLCTLHPLLDKELYCKNTHLLHRPFDRGPYLKNSPLRQSLSRLDPYLEKRSSFMPK